MTMNQTKEKDRPETAPSSILSTILNTSNDGSVSPTSSSSGWLNPDPPSPPSPHRNDSPQVDDTTTNPEDSSSSHHHHHHQQQQQQKNSTLHMVRRTFQFAVMVLFMGGLASTGFLTVGIRNARSDARAHFDRRASELVATGLRKAWHDYQVAALWVHEACRSRNITRAEFRALYEYLRSANNGGLDFQAAEFIPNVTRAQRASYEDASRQFYAQHYPSVLPYVGFRGLEPIEPDNPHNQTLVMKPRSEQPFYFPVYYVEPVESNAAAIDFDLYSSASRRATIDAALFTYQPHLTRRLRLVQETDPSAYSVLLMHPGIPVPKDHYVTTTTTTTSTTETTTTKARDLSLMVIRIPSLLERAVRDLQDERMAIYVYDVTNQENNKNNKDDTTIQVTAPADFLGGVRVMGSGTKLEAIPEIDYDSFLSEHAGKHDLLFQEKLLIGSSAWLVSIVPLDDGDYEANLLMVIFGGALLCVASLFLAAWMMHNARRTLKVQRIMEKAQAEDEIITSLFPSNVRDRILQEANTLKQQQQQQQQQPLHHRVGGNTVDNIHSVMENKPIADLFPDVTIMFADLVGFTSWASARDPTQVFTLLESVYHEFDQLSLKAKVFKVETIGDCYVAVSGCPEPRSDHAVCMARFAVKCVAEMSRVANRLEPLLGPDTGDLCIRVGLHSGQVTAGVLRGLKGRFQLFGDAMNTASRMESTGKQGAIQVSQECAEKLKQAGKEHWLVPRSDGVAVKGKGMLSTYWLVMDDLKSPESESNQEGTASSAHLLISDKGLERLVNWNFEVMAAFLKKIVAHRQVTATVASEYDVDSIMQASRTPMEEVRDSIEVPDFDERLSSIPSLSSIHLDETVARELRSFIRVLAMMYNNDNPFHNFDHASHVTMSVFKLLNRMGVDQVPTAELHEKSLGLTSDPLMQFACIFCALIHDANHPGIPNSSLITECSPLASTYHNKSIAEQNSIEICWNLFISPDYSNLRKAVCCNREELVRLRELVVLIVLATDVMDKEINATRRQRWDAAFEASTKTLTKNNSCSCLTKQTMNQRATIVLEHLIQASDVAHTMQHWHIYTKWNRNLFSEMHRAYEQGRLTIDPSDNWVKGECGFFDFYVIPLAQKLDACGVFGVTSDEFHNYAVQNRKEWEQKGPAMLAEYKERMQFETQTQTRSSF